MREAKVRLEERAERRAGIGLKEEELGRKG